MITFQEMMERINRRTKSFIFSNKDTRKKKIDELENYKEPDLVREAKVQRAFEEWCKKRDKKRSDLNE